MHWPCSGIYSHLHLSLQVLVPLFVRCFGHNPIIWCVYPRRLRFMTKFKSYVIIWRISDLDGSTLQINANRTDKPLIISTHCCQYFIKLKKKRAKRNFSFKSLPFINRNSLIVSFSTIAALFASLLSCKKYTFWFGLNTISANEPKQCRRTTCWSWNVSTRQTEINFDIKIGRGDKWIEFLRKSGIVMQKRKVCLAKLKTQIVFCPVEKIYS